MRLCLLMYKIYIIELQTEPGPKQEDLAGIYTHHRRDTSKTKERGNQPQSSCTLLPDM